LGAPANDQKDAVDGYALEIGGYGATIKIYPDNRAALHVPNRRAMRSLV